MTQTSRNHALDLIRGLAALGVVIYHYLSWSMDIHIQSLGTFSVYLFFVLSGLTMMMVYGPRFATGISPETIKEFFVNRVARLLPLLAAIAFLSFVYQSFVASEGSVPWREGALRALLTGTSLFSLQLPGYLSNTTGAWSLGIETVFYLLFPIIAVGAMNASRVTLAAIVFALVAAQHAGLYLYSDLVAKDATLHWNYYTTPLTFAPFFALGVFAFFTRIAATETNLVFSLVILCGVAFFSIITDAQLFVSHGFSNCCRP